MCIFLAFLALIFSSVSLAQQASSQQSSPTSQAPPRSEQDNDRETEAGVSSSKDTRIDLSAPRNDTKDHPYSTTSPAKDTSPEEDTGAEVGEMQPFNPYRAVKDVEVGDFYFKRKSYKAALARYQDALNYKQNDAIANFRIAECYEKLDQSQDSVPYYQEYLRILPAGPLSKDAKKALARLGAPEKKTAQ